MRDGLGFVRFRLGFSWEFLLSLRFSPDTERGTTREAPTLLPGAEPIPPLGPSLWKFPKLALAGKGLSQAGAPRCSPQSPPILAGSPNQQRWDLIPRNARAGQARSGKGPHEPAEPERGAGTSWQPRPLRDVSPGSRNRGNYTPSSQAQSCAYPRGRFHGSHPRRGRATGMAQGGRAVLIH